MITELVRHDITNMQRTPNMTACVAKRFTLNKYHLTNKEVMKLPGRSTMQDAVKDFVDPQTGTSSRKRSLTEELPSYRAENALCLAEIATWIPIR